MSEKIIDRVAQVLSQHWNDLHDNESLGRQRMLASALYDEGLLRLADTETVLSLVESAWDDGNAVGLDGWIGPGRGAGEVDEYAESVRSRVIRKAEKKLQNPPRAHRGGGRP